LRHCGLHGQGKSGSDTRPDAQGDKVTAVQFRNPAPGVRFRGLSDRTIVPSFQWFSKNG
jgi:hypothetical protein